MNILITGATGFVGLHLLSYLKTIDEQPTILALTRSPLPTSLDFVKHIPYSEDFDTILLEHKIDAIIHLLGKAHDTKNTSEPEEYFRINTELTCKLFDAFKSSGANKFVFVSTIKAVGDERSYVRNAQDLSTAQTPYAQSKRKAEEYIQSQSLPASKRFFILRPCLIYGPRSKGNLATLVKFVKIGLPYPFAAFENKRSYLSVNNLNTILYAILSKNYDSFTLNIANEDTIGTQELIQILRKELGKNPSKLNIPAGFIRTIAKFGDALPIFPFNTEKLEKITSSFVVDTAEMRKTLGFQLPDQTRLTIRNILY